MSGGDGPMEWSSRNGMEDATLCERSRQLVRFWTELPPLFLRVSVDGQTAYIH